MPLFFKFLFFLSLYLNIFAKKKGRYVIKVGSYVSNFSKNQSKNKGPQKVNPASPVFLEVLFQWLDIVVEAEGAHGEQYVFPVDCLSLLSLWKSTIFDQV